MAATRATFIALLALCLCLGGCGKKESVQPSATNTEAKKPEGKEAANPWVTPVGLSLFMAQTIEGSFKASTLRDIALALVKAGDVEQAVEVAQKIEDARFKASALRDIALALAKTGDVEQALEVAQKIERADIKESVLRDIASAQVEAGDKQQALATLKQAVEVAQKITDASTKVFVLRGIASALATEAIAKSELFQAFPILRIKKSFTPEEKQIAKQLVEAMRVAGQK